MTTTHTPRRALVLGASMAGLLTARVLSNHFDRVTIDPVKPWPPDVISTHQSTH